MTDTKGCWVEAVNRRTDNAMTKKKLALITKTLHRKINNE